MSKVAIITGAVGGLGAELAKSLWMQGFSLGLIVRPGTSLEKYPSLQFMPKNNQELHFFECDLSRQSDLEILVKSIGRTFKKVNILLNVAAVHGNIGPAITNRLDDWKTTFAINLDAPMYLMTKILPLMTDLDCSVIINFAGGGATNIRKNFTSYASSKTALVRFSEIFAAELLDAGKNTSINCISPGVLPTNLMKEIISSGSELVGIEELNTAKKSLSDDANEAFNRVINLVNFLASPAGSKITGKLISAVWDNWQVWPENLEHLLKTDAYTLRRIAGKDRGLIWGDL